MTQFARGSVSNMPFRSVLHPPYVQACLQWFAFCSPSRAPHECLNCSPGGLEEDAGSKPAAGSDGTTSAEATSPEDLFPWLHGKPMLSKAPGLPRGLAGLSSATATKVSRYVFAVCRHCAVPG